MELQMKLNKPIGGYWDGGAKDTFNFFLDGAPQRDKKGYYQKIGSWEANYWFNVAQGKTEKITLANAKRVLTAKMKKSGLTAEFEYIV